MPHFKAIIEDNTCKIFNTVVLAVIQYDDKRKILANLIVGDFAFRLEPGIDKNVRFLENGIEILKFKFDYWWGSATLITNGEPTGYKITGKAFKPGTRLVDADNNDMVIVKASKGSFMMADFDVEAIYPDLTPFLIAITVYITSMHQ